MTWAKGGKQKQNYTTNFRPIKIGSHYYCKFTLTSDSVPLEKVEYRIFESQKPWRPIEIFKSTL